MATLTKPIMLDETGLKIVDAINSKGMLRHTDRAPCYLPRS